MERRNQDIVSERAKGLASIVRRRFSFPATCLGVGFISTYTELSYVHPPIEYAGSSPLTFLLFDSSTILASILIAVFARLIPSFSPMMKKDGFIVLSGVLLVFTSCLNLSLTALGINLPVLVSTSALLAGVGQALMFIMWFEVVARLNPVQLILCYATAAVGRVCLIWLISALPIDRLIVCLCLVCVASLCLLRASRNALESGGSAVVEGGKCSFPMKPLLVVTIGSIAAVFMMNSIGNPGGVNGNPGVLIAAAIVAFLAVRKGDKFEFKRLWQMCWISMAVAAIPLALWDGFPLALTGVLAAVSYEMCLMLMYAILGNLAYRYAYNATFLFAIELAIALTTAHFGQFLGELVLDTWPMGGRLALLLLSGCLIVVFAAVVAWVFSTQNLEDRWGTVIKRPLAEDFDFAIEKTQIGIRCHELSQENGLSRREEEVLLCLAKGQKPSKVASELCIEVSTVNTHKKHIYQKLDVHSGKQLDALIAGGETDKISQK